MRGLALLLLLASAAGSHHRRVVAKRRLHERSFFQRLRGAVSAGEVLALLDSASEVEISRMLVHGLSAIDTNGDGKPDTLAVDTNFDGCADTFIPIFRLGEDEDEVALIRKLEALRVVAEAATQTNTRTSQPAAVSLGR